MKKNTLIVFSLLIILNSFSQTDTTKLRKLDIKILKSNSGEYGIYNNFNEFQDNDALNKIKFKLNRVCTVQNMSKKRMEYGIYKNFKEFQGNNPSNKVKFEYSRASTVLSIPKKRMEYGIYKNIKEFQDNNPSNKAEFKFNYASTFNSMSKKRIIKFFDKKSNKYRQSDGDYWGFCTGYAVFFVYLGQSHEISIDGKYTQFIRHWESRVNGLNYAQQKTLLLNLETGEIIPLTKRNLIKLLEIEDTRLLEEFKKEKRKEKKLEDYVGKINNLYEY
jgi:hypothetical protein